MAKVLTRMRRPDVPSMPPPAKPADVRHLVANIYGLKVDLRRLDSSEQAELSGLAARAHVDGGLNVQSFDKGDRQRWETLLEKASGASGHFAGERERARQRRELSAILARTRKPSRLVRMESESTVVLPPVVFATLAACDMQAVHATALLFIVAQIECGPLNRYAHVEDGVLILPGVEYLLAAHDPEGDVRRIEAAVRELHDAGWIDMQRSGGEVCIRLVGAIAEQLALREAA